MGAPITIKKRKMTVLTPTTAPAAGGAAESAENAPVSDEPFPDEPSNEPFIAHPPMPVQAKPSYTAFAILAVFATLFFIALLVMQWMEWSDFIPHFPRPIQTGNIVNTPS